MNIITKPPRLLCFLLALMILLPSCNPEVNQEISKDEIQLNIDPDNLPKAAKLSDIVEDVRLIPLETNSDCLINSTRKIFVGENHILVSDEGNPNALLHFSIDGKFLNEIGHQGKGPGEYTDIKDFTAFEDSQIVYLGMQRSDRILAYHFNGEFIEEIKLGGTLSNAKILDHNRLAFTSWAYELLIVDMSTQDTTKYFKNTGKRPETPYLVGHPQTGFFYSALGRDTIWRIDADSMRPAIIGNFGSALYSTEDYVNWVMDGLVYPPGKLGIVGPTFYGSGYYFFNLFRENEVGEYRHYNILVNESTQETLHFANGPESDDILFCTSTDFRTVAHTGEWVSVVGAYELIDAHENIKNNSDFIYSQEIMTQLQKMSVDHNPVLVLYKLKRN